MRDTEEEEDKKMLVDGTGDEKWREKMMEGEDGLRTVDCLRGRLLAERAASKVAKEDEVLIGNKLIELERQLKVEIKFRNRAEKKLKFVMKKMESLKLLPVLDQPNSSDYSEASSSSSATSSALKEPEEQRVDSQIVDLVKCNIEEETGEITDPSTSDLIHSNAEDGTAYSHNSKSKDSSSGVPNKLKDSLRFEEESMIDELRESSTRGKENSEYVDNTLALVPTNMFPISQTREPQISSSSVHDVLAALRHARKHLWSSIGRRDVIYSVGMYGGV